MSLLLQGARGAVQGFGTGGVVGGIIGGLSGILGGGDNGPNIAKKLSGQVGCQIPQESAAQARALIAKGIDPCTGQPTGAQFDTGIPAQTINLDRQFAGPAPGATPIPVGLPTGGATMPASFISGNFEVTRTGLIRSVIVGGRRVSRKAAASLIRRQGMEIGARALGISLQQAAQVILQQSQRPRRRRGISGKQITEAKRVINTIKTMSKALGTTTRRAPARKTSCR